LDDTRQGFPVKHVVERSKGIVNVPKRRRSIIILVFISTATARRRNGVGVAARQERWKNHTRYFHLASLKMGLNKKGF
jgi:hypothetical protein